MLGREIFIRRELDPRFQIQIDAALEAALARLLHFVFSTVPNGCEIFVASARNLASVADLGSGSVTLRWQAAGHDRSRETEKVTPLRPIAAGARAHVDSDAAARSRAAFEEAGWELELFAMSEDREIWARASTR